MSYCRFSSDDFQCDVYAYEDVSGGWTVHVASRRVDLTGVELPAKVPFDSNHVDAWIARHEEVSTILDDLRERDKWIDLTNNEHAGKSYSLSTPGEAAELLTEIKSSGLNVPDYAIEVLREEQRMMEMPISTQLWPLS